ncbi:MAG: MFS transporter [Candidatus Zipacnadales bacterium]
MLRFSDRLPVGLLIAAAFLMDLTYRAGAQAYQEAGLAFHATPFQLGLLGTLSAVCYSAVCLVAGPISDRLGRRISVWSACGGLALVYLIAQRATTTHQLLALVPFSGSALAFFWPAVQAWIADLSSRSRTALANNLGLFNISWSAGLAIGPTFTGYMWAFAASRGFSQALAFGSVAALAILVGLVIGGVHSQPHSVDTSAESAEAISPNPLTASLLLGARAGTFASWFAVGVIGSLFPKLAHTLDFDERLRGILASCYHVGQWGLFVAVLFGARWRLRRWPLAVAEVAALIGMVSVVWAQQPFHFGVAFLLAGVCSGVAYTGSLYHSLHGRTIDRGKLAGVHEAILASGVFLGPLLGGLLAQYVSLRAPFVLAGVVFAGALMIQFIAWQTAKKHHTSCLTN